MNRMIPCTVFIRFSFARRNTKGNKANKINLIQRKLPKQERFPTACRFPHKLENETAARSHVYLNDMSQIVYVQFSL